jgi:hypothetical protein
MGFEIGPYQGNVSCYRCFSSILLEINLLVPCATGLYMLYILHCSIKKVFEQLDCLVSSMIGQLCNRLFHTFFILLFLFFGNQNDDQNDKWLL